MNIQSLQCFKTVAETQNFRKAGEILNISQPAISHIIKKLQEELGCPLFNYRGKNVYLNTYGKLYLEYVSEALQCLTEGENRIHTLISPEVGTVRCTSLYTLSVNFLPPLIKDFKEKHPDITLRISQYPSSIQLQMLMDDETDLCFCTDVTEQDFAQINSLEKTTVMIEDLYLLVNKNHRLANRAEINLREIDHEDFISFSNLTYFKRSAQKIFDRLQIKPNITYECNEDASVAAFVAAGLGVALIPPIIGVDFSKCVAIPISYPVCQRTLIMLWNKNIKQRPAVEMFRNYVLKWLPDDKKYMPPNYP